MENLLVSVIVATYRRTDELQRALLSLKHQTFSNLEVIVVDDNSDILYHSKVKEICDTYASQIRINLIRGAQGRLGSSKARNFGINAAHGEYVTFLDDDDEYLPLKIEKQLSIVQNTNADFSVTDLALYSETEELIEYRSHSCIGKSNRELFKYHLMHHLTGTDTFMFRTEYLRHIGGFPPIDIGDEFYLMAEAIKGGGKCAYIPECYVKAYIHTSSGGLSSGIGKIDGEKELFRYKVKHFSILSKREIMYIKMRHHAVLAYAWNKRGNFIHFLIEGLLSVFSDPIDAICLFKASHKKITKIHEAHMENNKLSEAEGKGI